MPDPLTMAAIAAPVVGGLLGFAGQEQANAANAKQAELNRNFQERMSSTAYQRAVKDMMAAGLNPALAYQQGASSSPSGAQARMENSLAPLGGGVSTAVQTAAQIELVKAQTQKTVVEAQQISLESALRAASLQAETDLRGASAEQARSAAALAQRQLRELEETWPSRSEMPVADLFKKRLENMLASGTMEEQLIAAKIANELNARRASFEGGRAELMKMLMDVVRPYLGTAAATAGRLEKLFEVLPSFGELPDNFTPPDVKGWLFRGSRFLKEKGLGTGKVPAWAR